MNKHSYLDTSVFICSIYKNYFFLTEGFNNLYKNSIIKIIIELAGTIIKKFINLVKSAFIESKPYKVAFFFTITKIDVQSLIDGSKAINKFTKVVKLNKFSRVINRAIQESAFLSKGSSYLKSLEGLPLKYIGISLIFYSLIGIILDVTILSESKNSSLYIKSILLLTGVMLLPNKCSMSKLNESSIFVKLLSKL